MEHADDHHMPQGDHSVETDAEDTKVECSSCLEKHDKHEIRYLDNDAVCSDCIRTIFQNAIDNESNFPPRWGGKTLYASHFRHLMSEVMFEQLKKKSAEYQLHWDERVYCPTQNAFGIVCGQFLGARRSNDVKKRRKICQCGSRICLVCKEHVTKKGHECAPQPQEDANFGDLQRGKDWQKCPGCKIKVQLWDGCNHMRCSNCRTSFCFVCGGPAQENSNHWSRDREGDGCPRYNQPGEPNAMYQEHLLRPQDHPELARRILAHRMNLERTEGALQQQQRANLFGEATGADAHEPPNFVQLPDESTREMINAAQEALHRRIVAEIRDQEALQVEEAERARQAAIVEERRAEEAERAQQAAFVAERRASLQAAILRNEEAQAVMLRERAREADLAVRASNMATGHTTFGPVVPRDFIRRFDVFNREPPAHERQGPAEPDDQALSAGPDGNGHRERVSRVPRLLQTISRRLRIPPVSFLRGRRLVASSRTIQITDHQPTREGFVIAPSTQQSTTMDNHEHAQLAPYQGTGEVLSWVDSALSEQRAEQQTALRSAGETEARDRFHMVVPRMRDVPVARPLNLLLAHPDDTPRRAPRRRAVATPQDQTESEDGERFAVNSGLLTAWRNRERPRSTSPVDAPMVETSGNRNDLSTVNNGPDSDANANLDSQQDFTGMANWTGRNSASPEQETTTMTEYHLEAPSQAPHIQPASVESPPRRAHLDMPQNHGRSVQPIPQQIQHRPGIPERVSSLQYRSEHVMRQPSTIQPQHPHTHLVAPQTHAHQVPVANENSAAASAQIRGLQQRGLAYWTTAAAERGFPITNQTTPRFDTDRGTIHSQAIVSGVVPTVQHGTMSPPIPASATNALIPGNPRASLDIDFRFPDPRYPRPLAEAIQRGTAVEVAGLWIEDIAGETIRRPV